MVRRIASVAFALVGTLIACSSDDAVAPGAAAPNPDGKAAGAQCTKDDDCASLSCSGGKCGAVAGANPSNGKKDGDETDVDCGGKSAPKCGETKSCAVADDCESAACASGTCAEPSSSDNLKNGDETDVDCGGTTTSAPKCANDKGCAKDADCVSGACAYDNKCVAFASCAGHFGGDTCGAGEVGDADAKHESCCTTVTTDKGTVIGKYHVTAGRMRAFIERWNGDLQKWAASKPKGWNAAWNDQLPGSPDDVAELMGPNGKRGCNIGPQSKGARTYWQKDGANGDDEDKSDFDQNTLDQKALNCVTWYMAQALCVSDGGRLASNAELNDIISNGGATNYPWQFKDNSAYNPKNQDERLVHQYNYATKGVVRKEGNGDPVDRTSYIAPPGRFPKGADKFGAQDAVGNVLTWVNDGAKKLQFTMSWEAHEKKTTSENWNGSDGSDSYYALGARCVFPK